MKNKALKYALFITVGVVWGIIIYKVAFFVKKPSEPSLNIAANSANTFKNIEVDTFTIKTDYPDPFLKNTKWALKKSENAVNGKVIKSEAKKPIYGGIIWPDIIYMGYVSNHAGDKSSILLSINGSSYIMKKGNIIKNVELTIITRDSINVKYSGSNKYVKRYAKR